MVDGAFENYAPADALLLGGGRIKNPRHLLGVSDAGGGGETERDKHGAHGVSLASNDQHEKRREHCKKALPRVTMGL